MTKSNFDYIDRLLIWLKTLEIPGVPGYKVDCYGNMINSLIMVIQPPRMAGK